MKRQTLETNTNLIPVSREHHATLLFCWKLREGKRLNISIERMAKYIEWFWKNHLYNHFQTEESLLLTDTSDEKMKKAVSEHKMIYQKIKEIIKAKATNSYDKFLRLADFLHNHTRYEEREIYPHIEEKFSDEELNKIGKLLASENHAHRDYEDGFWVKKTS